MIDHVSIWFDRVEPAYRKPQALKTGGEFKRPFRIRKAQQEKRAKLRAANICINAGLSGKPSRFGIVHGTPNKRSGKCDRCELVAAQSRKKSTAA